jgi:hypothetical protein
VRLGTARDGSFIGGLFARAQTSKNTVSPGPCSLMSKM